MPESTASSNSFMQNTDTYQVLKSSTKYYNVFLSFILCCKMQRKSPSKQTNKNPSFACQVFLRGFFRAFNVIPFHVIPFWMSFTAFMWVLSVHSSLTRTSCQIKIFPFVFSTILAYCRCPLTQKYSQYTLQQCSLDLESEIKQVVLWKKTNLDLEKKKKGS